MPKETFRSEKMKQKKLKRYYNNNGKFQDEYYLENGQLPYLDEEFNEAVPEAQLFVAVDDIYYDHYALEKCTETHFNEFKKQFNKWYDELNELSYEGKDEPLQYFRNVFDNNGDHYEYVKNKGIDQFEIMLEKMVDISLIMLHPDLI